MPATRFYLTNGAADFDPGNTANWEDASSTYLAELSLTKFGPNTSNTVAETSATTGRDIMVGQWLSPPMTHAGILNGSHTLVIARNESDAAADFVPTWVISVISGDGLTLRGGNQFTSVAEWDTTLTAKTYTGTFSADITCEVGDRILLEFGYRANNSVTTSYSGTIRIGGTDATDLADGDTGANATARSPWIEFAEPEVEYLFTTKGISAWEGSIDGSLLVEVAWGADLTASSSTWEWTDITSDVRANDAIEITWGAGDEASSTQPASITMTLNNRSGDYSLGPQSANYPNVKRNTPVRVLADVGTGYAVVGQGGAVSWAPGWDITGNEAIVRLTVAGTMRRLEQGALPAVSVMRRRAERRDAEEGTTLGYWPCEDGADAIEIANPFNAARNMSFTGEAPEFATVDAFACSAPFLRLKATRLGAVVDSYTSPAGNNRVELSFLADFPESGITDGAVLVRLNFRPGGDVSRYDLRYGTGGNLAQYLYDTSGAILDNTAAIAFGVDGKSLHFELDLLNFDATDSLWSLSTMEPGASFSDDNSLLATGLISTLSSIEITPNRDAPGLGIGHIYMSSTNTFTFDVATELRAYQNETCDDRLDRLCDENSLTLSIIGTSDIFMGPQRYGTLLSLLRECEAADHGILADGFGSGLTYVARRNISTQLVPAFTIDASAFQLAEELRPVDDDQRIRNRVTVSRSAGASATYTDTDGDAGVTAVGLYDHSETLNLHEERPLLDHAAYFVRHGTQTGYRYPQVSIALHHDPELAAEWISARTGSRIDVTNLGDIRAQHPADDLRLVIEGATQRIDKFTWTVTMNVSSHESWRAGVIGEESGDTSEWFIRLDTDGSTLASSASAGATSLSVASSGALWTTDSDDLPLVVEINETPITVTAISGASSPQTFTVTGADVVRDLPSGAEVKLYRPLPLALGN